MENEPDLKWNKGMWKLKREIIHYRNGLDTDAAHKVKEYEVKYQKTLAIIRDEYEYVPLSDYYKDGYNLCKRLNEYKGNYLLFLHDHRVPGNQRLQGKNATPMNPFHAA